MSIKMMN